MTMRWKVVGGVVAVLALIAVPVLAQAYRPGVGWIGMAGGMGGGMGGDGMMGSGPSQGTGQLLTIDRAAAIARDAVARTGYAGLEVAHVMEFSNQFYVAVKEKATGQGAFELLVDRYTGAVHAEPQSMMWNSKYGPMAGGGTFMHSAGVMGSGAMGNRTMGPGGPGMMGGTSAPSVSPSVNLVQANALAQRFLDARFPGTKVSEAIAFPGYYTIDVDKNETAVGMLSVNAYTGQVWYHAWHGTFVQEKDVE